MAMNWIELKEEDQINTIKEQSKEKSVLIYKHSTRCSISSMSLDRLERSWNNEEMSMVKPYFLDLIQFKSLSNIIASEFNVHHESPQVLLIKDGKCFYHESHSGITYREITKQLSSKS